MLDKGSTDYSLILVGAHDGRKTEDLVKIASELGKVILVEPVPWLFEALSQRHAGLDNVIFVNKCVTEKDAESVSFYAPKPSAREVLYYGDQLGSIKPQHAVDHSKELESHIEEITCEGISFPTLLARYDVQEIGLLFTDTEGMDATLLLEFPFDVIKPHRILFEHMHSDGTFHIGTQFGAVLTLLDQHGYRTAVKDHENCAAILR
ncbi:MAG: FkbM family methyltransferase [Alphaproteobacteria bacterium]|nr:FkbM family methyltransferase [Alphaproteobacteria bacterium]